VRLVPEADDGHGATGSTVTISLADGRRLARHEASGMLEEASSPTSSRG
jgi:hypothetical protein